MERTTAYDLQGKQEEFVKILREKRFTDYTVARGLEGISSAKLTHDGKADIVGYLEGNHLYVPPTDGMSSVRMDERSRLLKLADDFKIN